MNRYIRQVTIPEIGTEGQKRLNGGKILVIGCGALGSLCSMYLAGAGVGTIRICDFDTIDISNLQRQLFFTTNQTGDSKVKILCQRMEELNPDIKVDAREVLFHKKTAETLLDGIDFVVAATDNPASKYQIEEECFERNIPYCMGGVSEFEGQVMTWKPGHARFIDIFPEKPSDEGFTTCSRSGVIGPAAGVVASLQAAEAIKFLIGAGDLLTDRLLIFNLLHGLTSTLTLSQD